MQPLEKNLRNRLEHTIVEARDVAEAASRAVLESLSVNQSRPFQHLNSDQREIRRKLQEHGRQLGDVRNATTKEQELDRLIEEIAYEHWHRMLFAKFLAQNDLLMDPDVNNPVAVTLEECAELAAKEGVKNGWELASRYATRMLPQIFRPDSPVFLVELPPEHQQRLEKLLDELPDEVFLASDSLGWVYQFWQSKKKEEVNDSEVKIGARELPAVTQIFTEPYMVSFLLDNSLGAWWAAGRLTEEDCKNVETEEELRSKASIPGVPLNYLRFIRQEDGIWTPAAGAFDAWSKNLSELKILDPCCGSGHFLVAALLMLVPMRMEVERLTAQEAVNKVLSENIHGLEIDRRCVEIAAFALALTAWKYRGAGGFRQLPELNMACSGLAVSVTKGEWEKLANGNQNMRLALGYLYEQFQNAPLLGSLLNPAKGEAARLIEWKKLAEVVRLALSKDRSDEEKETGVVAYGLAKAAALLVSKYHLVITNVPYLKRGKQLTTLKDFSDKYYYKSRAELATVFWERCNEFCNINGISCLVMPHFWLFHSSSLLLRKYIIENHEIICIAILGSGAFETISGEVVNVGLFLIKNEVPSGNHCLIGFDVTNKKSTDDKEKSLKLGEYIFINQESAQLQPDQRIIIGKIAEGEQLSRYAETAGGMQSFDKPRFIHCFFEIPFSTYSINGWVYLQSTINHTILFGGRENLFLWEDGQGQLHQYMECLSKQGYKSGVWRAGVQVWDKKGILFKLMGTQLCSTIYTGQAFENTTGVLIPRNESDLSAIWCYCSSDEYSIEVRKVDKKLAVTNGNLSKVPINIDYWRNVDAERYPYGLPKPYSNDPTQWIFHGHPCGNVVWDEATKLTILVSLRTDITVLQVAVARLLGYRWPTELDSEMELSDESRLLVEKTEELLSFADQDGIVCIPSVRGEFSATDRLLKLLAKAYGEAWNASVLSELLKQSDHADKSFETWLRDKFFLQHCQLFHHRPFIWHIWDGLRDGFAALVNYHKLDYKKLETLIYTYLGDWITRQKREKETGTEGAEEKLVAAEQLKKKLELILEGEPPYDIFVRWKPIEKQPIGWNPDLNDGIRLNIRPFMIAGVLRFNKKPQLNITWNKDRGKDVESAPWFHLDNGDRINDHHLTLDEKRKAQESAQ